MDRMGPSTTMVSQRDIVQGLRRLELKAGSCVLVHSALSSFGHVQGGVDAVIDALLEAVGPEGTVVVPTLSGSADLDADHPPFFDPSVTVCWTGRIPETFRRRPEAMRSLHPTHSVAAIGPMARALVEGHEFSITPCGPDSPYGRLVQARGFILLLGVTHSSNTTFHHVEEIVGVPYHMQPGLVAARVVKEGKVQNIHLMLHRYGPRRNFERMEPVFRERGIQRDGQIGMAHVRLIDAYQMVEVTRQALLQDPAILLAEG
jgi:aminoglycoside 3-N-acetyltransferase